MNGYDVHWLGPGDDGIGFELGRCDGLMMSRCFMIGGHTFLRQVQRRGDGDRVGSLNLLIDQVHVEAVKYGFRIEGDCGFVLSDSQILVRKDDGVGVDITAAELNYHCTISGTQIRTDGAATRVSAIRFCPRSADHYRNHAVISNCDISDCEVGIVLGESARRVSIINNHFARTDVGIRLLEPSGIFGPSPDYLHICENFIQSRIRHYDGIFVVPFIGKLFPWNLVLRDNFLS